MLSTSKQGHEDKDANIETIQCQQEMHNTTIWTPPFPHLLQVWPPHPAFTNKVRNLSRKTSQHEQTGRDPQTS